MIGAPDGDGQNPSRGRGNGPHASLDATVRTGRSPDGLPPLRDVISTHNLAPKKNLGQNFLLDINLTRKLARAAGPLKSHTVIEVGPGPGGLTRALYLRALIASSPLNAMSARSVHSMMSHSVIPASLRS